MSVNPELYLPKAKSSRVNNNNLNLNQQKAGVEIVNNEGINCLDFLNAHHDSKPNEGSVSQWKSSLFNLKMVILIISLYGLFNQYSLICCSNTSPQNTQNIFHGLYSTTFSTKNKTDLFWEFMERYENLKLSTKNNISTEV